MTAFVRLRFSADVLGAAVYGLHGLDSPPACPLHCHSALTAGRNSQNSSQTTDSSLCNKALNTERQILNVY